jgi:orotidine-5'-phosphate decarboxylase
MSTQIILALDQPLQKRKLESYVREMTDYVAGFKLGPVLINTPSALAHRTAEFIKRQYPQHVVFWDDKIRQPQKTTVKAVKGLRDLGVDMYTIWSSWPAIGVDTLEATAAVRGDMKQLVVVELTDSLMQLPAISEKMACVYILVSPARISDPGKILADGLICAPRDLWSMNQLVHKDDNFLFVTPGIRKPGTRARPGDFRSATPRQIAIQTQKGCVAADYLVVGSAINRSSNPRATAKYISDTVNGQR